MGKKEQLVIGNKTLERYYNTYTFNGELIADCINDKIFVYYDKLISSFNDEECYHVLAFIAEKELGCRLKVGSLFATTKNGVLIHKIYQAQVNDDKTTDFVNMTLVEDERTNDLVDYFNCEVIFHIKNYGA